MIKRSLQLAIGLVACLGFCLESADAQVAADETRQEGSTTGRSTSSEERSSERVTRPDRGRLSSGRRSATQDRVDSGGSLRRRPTTGVGRAEGGASARSSSGATRRFPGGFSTTFSSGNLPTLRRVFDKKQEKAIKAAKRVADSKNERTRLDAMDDLKEILGEIFDERMAQQQQAITKLEERIRTMKQKLNERKNSKREVIDLRAKVMEQQAKGMGWPQRTTRTEFSSTGSRDRSELRFPPGADARSRRK